jgi:predicted acylesterase/phospholipase RssA
MTIKHLVISGGGPSGITTLGLIQYLEKAEFFCMNDIETIYGTSMGTIIGTLLSLKFDLEMIVDYFIKRPWHEAFPVNLQSFFDAYSKKGLFDTNIFEIFFKPFFDARDIKMDITMKELYEITKIELHFFTFEINQFEVVDISYKSFPELSLLKAIHMSSAVPIIISPVFIDDKCYVDGGVVCNYPLKYCIDSKCSKNEILAIKNKFIKDENKNITNESNMMDYIMKFINKLIDNAINVRYDIQPNCLDYELLIETYEMSIPFIQETIYNQKKREELFEKGIEYAKKFLEKIEMCN